MTTNADVAVDLFSTQTGYKKSSIFSNRPLQQLAISENGFIFDPTTGQSFTANEVGIELLYLFQQENNIDAIVTKLHRKYKAGLREIERDILEFAGSINRYF